MQKFLLKQLLLLLLLAGSNKLAFGQANAEIVVALDGSGNYSKIQDAIDAVPANRDRTTIIYIKRGLYNTEKLIVPGDKKKVTFIGESREETIISYHMYDCATGKCPTADAAKWTGDNIRTSATLTLQGDDFRAENLTIRNTAGPVGQAQAITVMGDRNVFINCNLEGYQDTIYLWQPGKRSYFENCLITGRTDYIYGAGIAFFENCEIRSWGGGWITAPSTPENQTYGYVFNNSRLTYALNSPRSGDDGALVRLGRPWHEYPHVVWMNTHMSEKIHHEGWGDKWNMAYADTDPRLKLYEYNNTGPGADMSRRANWVGLRALTAAEAANYTVQRVMAGPDNWDPTATPPSVQTYTWTGTGATKSWKLAGNWNPSGVPATGEVANISGQNEVLADGGDFGADLHLTDGVTLRVTANSTAAYLTMASSRLAATEAVSLGGKIATKGANTLDVAGTLTLSAALTGVHEFSKEGIGKVILSADNINFSGPFLVKAGSVEGAAANSLGKGHTTVNSGASLIISHSAAFQPRSQLRVVDGSSLVLNADITLSEFYINDQMQPLAEYTAATNPTLISGTGKIVVGRPSSFNFVGGANGNWDLAAHYAPQLVPQADETVMVGREIETTSGFVMPAKLVIGSTGSLRIRGQHSATGEIEFLTGARISYATNNALFSLNAPVTVTGDMLVQISSGHAEHQFHLLGPVSGAGKMTIYNSRGTPATTVTMVLKGDNRAYTGTFDLTRANSVPASVTRLVGDGEYAFGNGTITVGANNILVFNHTKSAGDNLDLTISGTEKAVLNVDVAVKAFKLNGTDMDNGTYSATTHPEHFTGTGSIVVSRTVTSVQNILVKVPVSVRYNTLHIDGIHSNVTVYTITGKAVVKESGKKVISLDGNQPGLYIARYLVDGKGGSVKIFVR